MNVSIARLSLSLLLVATCIACMAGTASAVGTQGQIDLSRASSAPGQIAGTCRVSGDRLFLTADVGLPLYGLAPTWSYNHRIATTSIPIRPKASAKKARWRFHTVARRSLVVAQSFDAAGRLFYVTQSDKRKVRNRLTVRRIEADGKLSGHATIVVDHLKFSPASKIRVIPAGDGSALIVAKPEENPELIRLTAELKIDSTWGDGGRFKLIGGEAGSVILTGDGSVLAGLSAPLSAPGTHVPGVVKLTPQGKIDTAWGAAGYWLSPAAPVGAKVTRPGVVRETLQTTSGAFAFHYADEYEHDLGTDMTSSVALVNAASGATEKTLPGTKWYYGGDGGFPDTVPEYLGATKTSVAFARGDGFYANGGATRFGNAFRVSASATTGGTLQIKKFAANAFAADPQTEDLYACGGAGKIDARFAKGQLSHVAVRKVRF